MVVPLACISKSQKVCSHCQSDVQGGRQHLLVHPWAALSLSDWKVWVDVTLQQCKKYTPAYKITIQLEQNKQQEPSTESNKAEREITAWCTDYELGDLKSRSTAYVTVGIMSSSAKQQSYSQAEYQYSKELQRFENKVSQTKMHLLLPTAHRLTFWSSPPDTKTRPELWPSATQLTFPACATNSSARTKIFLWQSITS